jgi:hypothetical protein
MASESALGPYIAPLDEKETFLVIDVKSGGRRNKGKEPMEERAPGAPAY